MFESFVRLPVDRMSGSQLAGAISGNQAELMRAECRTLELACAWADLHTREPGEYSPLVERAKFYGGAGTPEISEFCVAELAALQGTGMLTAQMLIADGWICGIGCPGYGPRSKRGRSAAGRPAGSPNRPGRCPGKRARRSTPSCPARSA